MQIRIWMDESGINFVGLIRNYSNLFARARVVIGEVSHVGERRALCSIWQCGSGDAAGVRVPCVCRSCWFDIFVEVTVSRNPPNDKCSEHAGWQD